MTNDKIFKISKIAVAALALIGVLFLVRVMLNSDEDIKTDADLQSGIIDPFVTFTIFMLYVSAGLAILFSIFNLVKNPEQLKKTAISLGVLVVIYIISYVLASDAEVTGANGISIEGGATGSTPKMVGTLINYTYILGLAGLALVMLNSVKGIFSNK